MKIKKRYLFFSLIFLAALLFILRGSEDDWICDNGQWAKHGNPAHSKPTGTCGPISSYDAQFIGYFYPNYGKTEIFIESPPLKTIEECRDWVEVQHDNYSYKESESTDYDYECGKDCTIGDKYSAGVKYTCQLSVD